MVPLMTTEEVPVLSDKERAAVAASLRRPEARMKAGKGVDYDPRSFKDRLIAIYRGGKQ